MPASLGELATEFGCELVGDPGVRVDRVATLVNASPKSVGFLASPAYRNELLSTRSAAVVLTEADAGNCRVCAPMRAEKDKDWKRMIVRFRRSETLEKRVAELEAKVNKNDG